MNLNSKVNELKGIGPKKTKALSKLGLETILDCLYYFPRTYQDRSKITTIKNSNADDNVLLEARVISNKYLGNNRKSLLKLVVSDGTENLEIAFFNGKFLKSQFVVGENYSFYGKVSYNGGRKQMVQPDFALVGSSGDLRGIIPIYPLTSGISQKDMLKLQLQLKEHYDDIEEWLPEEMASRNRLADLPYSIGNMHFPAGRRELLQGKFRLIFDELLIFQLGLLFIRSKLNDECKNFALENFDGDKAFLDTLPFQLTSGQAKVWADIKAELLTDKKMNRLIQGDVGSGKTIIAELGMFMMAGEGYQSVMMAPTELLAKQHLKSIRADFSRFGLRVELLCGSMTKKEKTVVLDGLKTGQIDVLIGTHAVIQPTVEFKNLGLVITDEQHRFGVDQRVKLNEKGLKPNLIVMTATPIPRTLAVILYGDLDISIIDTMPNNRKPIKTMAASKKERSKVYSKVKSQVEAGRQAYVVAPLIEMSEAVEAISAEELYDELTKKFSDFKVALVHGNLKQDEKDEIMNQFTLGEIDMLVSTVVIEVGINVPNATVMVIEDCQRFGLAQLHQLRGRVGRGSEQSFCFLVGDFEKDIAKKRIETMCRTNSGFIIAEEDLQLRGPGEIFGTRQHGLPELHLADLFKHIEILEQVKRECNVILADDPRLNKEENSRIKEKIKTLYGDEISLKL